MTGAAHAGTDGATPVFVAGAATIQMSFRRPSPPADLLSGLRGYPKASRLNSTASHRSFGTDDAEGFPFRKFDCVAFGLRSSLDLRAGLRLRASFGSLIF